MKPLLACVALLLLGGCGSVEYRDTNAAVDARPECVGSDDAQPGMPVPDWCERSQGATWSSEPEPEPIDFSDDDEA